MFGLESLSDENLLALVAIQHRQIEDLKSTVGALANEVERLRSQLGRNSGNSSMPPSSDGFVKAERRKKPSSGRPRGKQPGMVEHPDVVVDVFPPAWSTTSPTSACGSCSVTKASPFQLDLERHGGRTVDGVMVRVLQRILVLTAAIWHNDHIDAGPPFTDRL